MKIFSHRRLSDLLKDPKYKMSGVALSVGISPSGLAKIRRGESVPSANVVAGLSKVLGCPIDALFEESEHYSEVVNG